MDKKDNLNKLKTVISSIEKSYGKGSIMMLGKKMKTWVMLMFIQQVP